jgi:hypothetical protein
VVAAPTADAIDLATRTENKGGMGVRGGTFVPGVEVVAVDDQEGMTIIPASRLAVYDQGLEVRSAEHASIDMRDTPTADAVTTSLWQSNLIGLLIERNWHLAGDAHVVVVE